MWEPLYIIVLFWQRNTTIHSYVYEIMREFQGIVCTEVKSIYTSKCKYIMSNLCSALDQRL